MDPMQVTVEVWPVAADATGIWLLSDTGPWPSEPIEGEFEPHDYAELELMQHQAFADTRVLHSTSWRVDGPVMVLTYLAVVWCPGPVRSTWPDARPVSVRVADAAGPAPTHGAVEPPTVRYWDVLLHGLRHLRFLLDTDATVAAELDVAWRQHLAAFEPAIARMYSDLHEAV